MRSKKIRMIKGCDVTKPIIVEISPTLQTAVFVQAGKLGKSPESGK